MARYVFSLPTLSVAGRPGRVTFHDREESGQRLTDLWLFDDDENPTTPLPNGLLVTAQDGTSADFLGPEERDALWYSVNGGARAEATADHLSDPSPELGGIDIAAVAAAVSEELDLGGSALLDVGTGAGTVAAGNDSRVTGAAQKSANLSDLGSAGTARTNLGLGGAATLAVGTGAGTVAAGDDSRIAGSAQRARLATNVKDHGAIGDGVADDTAAIDAAFAASSSVYFPDGTYNYSGSGYSGDKPAVRGQSRARTVIVLGADCSLLARSSAYTNLQMQDLTISGGFGAIRHAYTGVNVQGEHLVDKVHFVNYTGAAISSLSSDMPYWRITRNTFSAANYTTTMGVALGGNTDLVTVRDNDFLKNRVHVKLTKSGNNAHIVGNDFIRFNGTEGQPRVDVWIAPHTGTANSGAGLTISRNKFGNENVNSGDLRIVYADEDAVGADRATKFPVLNTASTGYISGHHIAQNLLNGSGSAPVPFVFSTTPNIRGCTYSGLLNGATPTYIVEYLTAPGAANRNSGTNIIGPFLTGDGTTGIDVAAIPPTNDPSYYGDDPLQLLHHTGPLQYTGGSDPAGYAALLATAINSFTLSSATKSAITDALGGADAAEVTLASGSLVHASLSAPAVGVPVWVEFDLKQGASGPATQIGVQLQYTASGAIHWRRIVKPLATWRRHRYLAFLRESTTTVNVVFYTNGSETGTIQIGRVRVYHAYEPRADGVARLDSTQTFTAPQTITTASSPLTLNRTGGGEPGVAMAVNGASVGQVRGIVGGGVRLTNSTGATEFFGVIPNGHTALSATSLSTLAAVAGAAAGTGATVGASPGSDTVGTIAVTLGSGPGAGELVTATFGAAFASAPRAVALTSKSSGAADAGLYLSSVTTTGFVVSCTTAPATDVTFSYLVLA